MFESFVIWAQGLNSLWVYGGLFVGLAVILIVFNTSISANLGWFIGSVVLMLATGTLSFVRFAYDGAGFTAREFAGMRDSGPGNAVRLKGSGESDNWVFISNGVELARLKMKVVDRGYVFSVVEPIAKANPIPVGAAFELTEASSGLHLMRTFVCSNCPMFQQMAKVATPMVWFRVENK